MSDIEDHAFEISLMSIIAVFIKRLNILLYAVILGFVLCGGYKYITNPPQKSEKSYNEQINQWTVEKNIKERNLSVVEKQCERQFLYNDTAPIMKIDSEAVVKTVVPFIITSEETYIVTSSSGDREMPLAYIAAQKYIDDWKSVDIVSVVNNGIEEAEWLREVILLNTSESNLATSGSRITSSALGVSNTSYTVTCPLVLTVYSATEEEGNYLSTVISDYLLSMKERVAYESFAHTITMDSVKQIIENNSAVSTYQIECIKKADSLTKQVKTLKSDINTKKRDKPDAPIKGILKTAITGSIASAFLVCVWILLSYIGRASFSSSYEFAERTHYTYLGGFYRRRKFCEWMTDKFLNERVFKSSDEAELFVVLNSGTVIKKGSKVLIASTLFKNEQNEEVAYLIEALKKAGYIPAFTGNTVTSSNFITNLTETECVILLEKRWISRWQNVKTEIEMINRLEKEVSGFVLV